MLNMKGIDPLSLDIFSNKGILALYRVKRQNMERLSFACGGALVNYVEDMDASMLVYAVKVSKVMLGEDEITFAEECRIPKARRAGDYHLS